MKPKEFRKSREEYKKFPLKVFRHHIYQERRKKREEPGFVAKRNKKAQNMHEKEVKSMKDEWVGKRKKKDIDEMVEMWKRMNLDSDDSDSDEN